MDVWGKQTDKTIVRIQLLEHSTVGDVSSANGLTVKEVAIHHNSLLGIGCHMSR